MVIGNIILGIGIAALLLLYLQHKSDKYIRSSLANGLIIAALIYVFFALRMPSIQWIAIELGGVLIYTIFAIAALRHALFWLGIGWILHIVWDAVLHANGYPGYVPLWYIDACIGFDIVVGVYILWKYFQPKDESNVNATLDV